MEDGRSIREKLEGRELRIFCNYSMLLLFAAGIINMEAEGGGILAALINTAAMVSPVNLTFSR